MDAIANTDPEVEMGHGRGTTGRCGVGNGSTEHGGVHAYYLFLGPMSAISSPPPSLPLFTSLSLPLHLHLS